jgi:hypothetical protein
MKNQILKKDLLVLNKVELKNIIGGGKGDDEDIPPVKTK